MCHEVWQEPNTAKNMFDDWLRRKKQLRHSDLMSLILSVFVFRHISAVVSVIV